jgi:exonuclease VII small subunit
MFTKALEFFTFVVALLFISSISPLIGLCGIFAFSVFYVKNSIKRKKEISQENKQKFANSFSSAIKKPRNPKKNKISPRKRKNLEELVHLIEETQVNLDNFNQAQNWKEGKVTKKSNPKRLLPNRTRALFGGFKKKSVAGS